MTNRPRLMAVCSLAWTVTARKPGLTAASALTLATGAELGLLALFTGGWALVFRAGRRDAQRPWWAWAGWSLWLLAAVLAALWSVYYLGSSALGWVVPSVVTILIAIFVLWYQKTDQLAMSARDNATGDRVTSVQTRPQTGGRNFGPAPPETKAERPSMADPGPAGLTLSDLVPVITIVADRLDDKGQIQSIMKISGLRRVAFPTGDADAGQLWSAVFDKALDEPPSVLTLLLDNIRGSLGQRSRDRLDAALHEIGL